jgi:hypothetical protein
MLDDEIHFLSCSGPPVQYLGNWSQGPRQASRSARTTQMKKVRQLPHHVFSRRTRLQP